MITRFKTGDKVRFLNEKEEGVVSRITKNLVYVEVSSGFEIPVQEKELVLIEEVKKQDRKEEPKKIFESQEEEEYDVQQSVIGFTKSFEEEAYIVFETNEEPASSARKLKVHILNNTEYNLWFVLSSRAGNRLSFIKSGPVKQKSSVFLSEFSKDDLESWSNLHIQCLYFREPHYDYKEPSNHIIRVKPSKFYKDSSFAKTDFFKGYCLIEPFKEQPAIKTTVPNASFSNESIARFLQQKEKPDIKQLSKPNPGLLEMEVDLHIEEILENYSGMSNGEIIQYQLSYCQQKLDEAIANHYRRVIFIHGVGNGRLKGEVRRILKNFPGVKFQDGSFQRYGFGATEVIIL